MTREEAIKGLKPLVEVRRKYGDMQTMKYEADCLDMAIKALQEPVLDKIRAEIEAKCCFTVGEENDGAITLHDVFEIIDKYKAESEE